MPSGDSVTLASVYELVAAEHRTTSEKLEGLRAEGREREREFLRAIVRTDVAMRAYVDDVQQEIKRGVENETATLQTGMNELRTSLFGNGDMENSIAFRLKAAEDMQARWTKISNRLLVGVGIPLTLGILSLLWLLLIGKAQIILH